MVCDKTIVPVLARPVLKAHLEVMEKVYPVAHLENTWITVASP
jgi:hypothetical protein